MNFICPRKKDSEVWGYFEPIKKGQTTSMCKLCSLSVTHSGNTTNFRSHLLNNHPSKEIYEKFITKGKNKRSSDSIESPIPAKLLKKSLQVRTKRYKDISCSTYSSQLNWSLPSN